jgi:outer membrane protein assembly factor BamB
MDIESIEWQWDDTDLGGHADAGGDRFVFTLSDDANTAEIQRVDTVGDSIWVQTIAVVTANSAALVVHDGRLYVALYSRNLTGCRVLALDASSGDRLWETPLKGLGSILHSKYANRVQMRVKDEWLLIFGDESSGRYIEILDLASGRRIYNQRVQS